MIAEIRNGVVIVSSELTDSVIRVERQSGVKLVLCLASRDNSGRMHIESYAIPMEDIESLPIHVPATYRSLTDEERARLNGKDH